MKFQVLQENLNRAISQASRFASTRAQLPVLTNVLLSAQKEKLNIAATNLEVAISLSVGAKVEKEGKITVPAKTANDIVSNLSRGPVEISAEKETLTIKQGSFSSNLSGVNPSDFPVVPDKIGKDGLSIKVDDFLRAFSRVSFACSLDETRPILTGVMFWSKKDDLTLVATDGFRLSQKKLSMQKGISLGKVVFPKYVLSEVSRSFVEDEYLQIAFNQKENQVVFKIDNAIISSRVIEGEFPDYEKIIPKSHTTTVNVNKEDLVQVIKLAAVFARDSGNVVKLGIKKTGVVVASESQYSGSQKNSVDAKVEGDDLDIAFNYRFIEDFLGVVGGESVHMEFGGPQSAGVFKDPDDKNYLHLIMPVKI